MTIYCKVFCNVVLLELFSYYIIEYIIFQLCFNYSSDAEFYVSFDIWAIFVYYIK